MKNIKFLSFLILSLFVFQTAIGQSETDDKGRNKGATVATPQTETPVPNVDVFNGSDQDIPFTGQAQAQTPSSDWVLPNDLDVLQDELLNASSSPQEITTRLNEMEQEMAQLRQYNEQLRLENRVIKKSLGTCCSDMGLNLNAADAYLMQNTPNPATDVSEIRYFVPRSVSKAQVKISDVTGIVVETFPITDGGFGAINIERGTYQNGTYIYSLEIDGELIDTKVMVFTK